MKLKNRIPINPLFPPNKYPAITSCLYHETNDDLKNLNGTFPNEPRMDIILKYIYYFKSAKNGFVVARNFDI